MLEKVGRIIVSPFSFLLFSLPSQFHSSFRITQQNGLAENSSQTPKSTSRTAQSLQFTFLVVG